MAYRIRHTCFLCKHIELVQDDITGNCHNKKAYEGKCSHVHICGWCESFEPSDEMEIALESFKTLPRE